MDLQVKTYYMQQTNSIKETKVGIQKNYGIGLFVAEQIIKMHGGSLVLENRSDKIVAKVSILLPVKE